MVHVCLGDHGRKKPDTHSPPDAGDPPTSKAREGEKKEKRRKRKIDKKRCLSLALRASFGWWIIGERKTRNSTERELLIRVLRVLRGHP